MDLQEQARLEDGNNLSKTNIKWQKDRDVVSAAILKIPEAIQFAGWNNRKEIKQMVLDAVKQDVNSLGKTDIKWRKDRDVVLAAILKTLEAAKVVEPPFN